MRANDVREVAQAERERRFIGFIYADGNGIGKRLVAARTRQEFEQISHDLREAVPKAVFRALAEHIKVRKVKDEEGQERPVHPWEIIALGGDDALVIVPGDVALQIAEATCRYFTQNLREAGWQDPPTMSAGVVIAHESNPIRFVRELAEQLLKSAKRRTRELRQPDGAIDFIVLKSQSMVAADLDTLRQQAYTAMVGPREQLHLAGRPFSLMELRALLTQARALRTANFPRSQTQAIRASIREAAHMGRPWTALFYHRQWDRMPVEQKALLNEIEKYWRGVRPNSTIDVYPWLELEPKHGQQRAVSVWEDLHEIRDLLPTEAVERHTQTAELGDFTQLVKEETERLKKEAANANANTGD
jgi:CRISPR-associated protein Cmr2